MFLLQCSGVWWSVENTRSSSSPRGHTDISAQVWSCWDLCRHVPQTVPTGFDGTVRMWCLQNLSSPSRPSGSLLVPHPAQPLRLFFWRLWFRLVEFQINHVYLDLICQFVFLPPQTKENQTLLSNKKTRIVVPDEDDEAAEGASALKMIGSITEFQITQVRRKLGALTWRRYINHPVAIKLPLRLFPPHLKLGGA